MRIFGKHIILTASILAISLTCISQALGEVNKNEAIPEKTKAGEITNTLSRGEYESIRAKVVSLDINADKEQKSFIIRCLGSLANKSDLILKNIKVTVQIMDTNKNLIEEIPLDYIDRVEPGQEKSFKIEKYINTKSSPYDIRAKAIISEVEKTDAIQIAQWFIDGRKEMLKYWDIPFNEKEFQNGSNLRDSAIKVLDQINPDDINYQKARDMINQLRYTEGLINLSAADYSNAFINLIEIAPEHDYSGKAEKLIDLYRPQTVFEKAKSYYPKKDYIKALSLFRTIPPQSELYFEAQKELKKLYFLTGTSLAKKSLPDLNSYTEDQVKIIKLMENKPELILKNLPSKNQTIWVFSDFSHFNFDENGKLVKYRIYPLF